MIEIIFLFLLCKDIGKIVRRSGRKPLGFQFLLILLWFCGEFIGGSIATIVSTVIDGRYEGIGILGYVVALAGAAVGAMIAFRIAKSTAIPVLPSRFPVIMAEPLPPADERIAE